MPPPDGWLPPLEASRGQAPDQSLSPDQHPVRSMPITWSPRLGSRPQSLFLLLLALLLVAVVRSQGLLSPSLTYLTLLFPSVIIATTVANLRVRRQFPFTAVIDHDALWVWTARSPLITELSRREGALLRVTKKGRLRLLALVRPDGTSTAPILVAPAVLDALRSAALRSGWAWQGAEGLPDYPPGWAPRLLPPFVSPITLTAPSRRGAMPARIIAFVGLLAVALMIWSCLVVTDSALITYCVTVAIAIALLLIRRRVARFAPGRVLDVTERVLRITHSLYVIVLTRETSARVVLDETDLKIVDGAGRTVTVVRCPAALPQVRAVLAQHSWSFDEGSRR